MLFSGADLRAVSRKKHQKNQPELIKDIQNLPLLRIGGKDPVHCIRQQQKQSASAQKHAAENFADNPRAFQLFHQRTEQM